MKPTNFNSFKKINSNFFDILYSLAIIMIMFLIISNPKQFSSSTINGLNLFINSVLPGLFPFMLLTKLLTELGLIFKITKKCNFISRRIFGTPGVSLYAFLMSILSGYPIGAKIISDLYAKNLISSNDAKKMSLFCTTSGPIFIIGAVGVGMLNNYKAGLIIYISHILSSIILGITYNILSKQHKNENVYNQIYIDSSHKENILSNSINQTINSIFVVGAFITIFYLLSDVFEVLKIFDFLSRLLYFILSPFKFSFSQCQSLVYGLLEVTRGCKSLSLNINTSSISLCCFIISFSGLSIILQSLSFLKNTKIKTHTFILFKLMHALLSFIICSLILMIFL